MKQALKGFKADGVHYHLIRMFGVMAFSLALSGFMALGFQNENDQQAYLFGRVVVRTDIFVMCELLYEFQSFAIKPRFSCFNSNNMFILMDGKYSF